jgi:hypothetical protein
MLCTLFYNSVYCSLSVVDVTLFRPSVDIYYAGSNGQSPSVYSVYIYLYIRPLWSVSGLDGLDGLASWDSCIMQGCSGGKCCNVTASTAEGGRRLDWSLHLLHSLLGLVRSDRPVDRGLN